MPMPTQMPEHIATHYKTSDVEMIVKSKAENAQTRAVASSKPVKVELTADECKKLCKEAGVAYYPGYEGRVLQYTMSDETVDRYGDIVKAAGCDMMNYKKNAVIMTFHEYKQFPVGCCVKAWVDKGESKVKGWVLIVDDQVDKTGVSDTAFRFASSGYMKAGSIGFMPKKTYRPNAEEREALGMGEWGLMFKEWELMEFSLCGVPANPNAVQESVQRGIMQQKDVEVLKRELPTDEFKDFIASVEALIKEGEQSPVVPETITQKEPAPATAPLQTVTLSIEELSSLVEKTVAKALAANALPQKDAPVVKAGAMLSKKNKELVNNAVTQMSEAVTALQALLAAADKTSDSSDEDDTTPPADESKEADGVSSYDTKELEEILADLSEKIKTI